MLTQDINTTKTMLPFRGLFTDISTCKNDSACIIEKAGLDWKGIKMPLMIQGARELHPYGQYATVNSKTGNCIDGGRQISENFQLPNNKEIITDMCNFAQDNGLTMHHAGMIEGGRLVIGHAVHPDTINITAEDKGYAQHLGDLSKSENQDLVEAGIVMVASYESGKVSTWRPYANRFVCTNGVIITAKELGQVNKYRLPHRGEKYDRSQVKGVFNSFANSFGAWGRNVKILAETPATRPMQIGVLMETIQGDLWDALIDETYGRYGTPTATPRQYYLDALHSTDFVEKELLTAVQDRGNRALLAAIELNDNQPGVEFVRGTLAQPYHAITHWVDHYRGKVNKQDAAVEASLFGLGAQMKQGALEVAMNMQAWAQTVQ